MGIFLMVIVILLAILFFRNVCIVKEKHAYIIERLGRYHKTWHSGIHVKMPFIDTVVRKMSLKEQVLDFPPQPVITKDNVTMQIDSVVYAYIYDPKLYTYGVENPMVGLQNMTATTLRNIIGDMELDQTLTSREAVNAQMQQVLDKATDPWGLKVRHVEIKNINPPKEIEEVMTKQMRAERERRQTVLEAKAHQEAVVARAEGDKQAKILEANAVKESQIILAQGEAERIRLVNQAEVAAANALRQAGAADVVMKMKNISALKDVADGQATKIFIPTDMTDMMGAAAVFGEVLKGSPTVQTQPRDAYRQSVTNNAARSAVREDACLNPESSRQTKGAAMSNARQSQMLNQGPKR